MNFVHKNNFKNSHLINIYNRSNPTMTSCLKEFQISFHEFITNQNEFVKNIIAYRICENRHSNSLSDLVTSLSLCLR